MITILSSPKTWSGLALKNQLNAIRNWIALHQDVEIILYGNAPGTSEVCKRFGISHISDILGTPQGIPYFGAIVNHAAVHGKYDIQCYVNCDILFSKSLLKLIQSLHFKKYLMVGQRIDLTEGTNFDTTNIEQPEILKTLASEGKAVLHPPAGSDYFLFRRGMWEGLPKIVIGRGGYDNALIAHCLRQSIPVIDASFYLMIFHQYHNYNHIQGGEAEVFCGIEAKNNLNLLMTEYIPTLINADWIIKKGKLRKNYCRGDLLQFLWASKEIKGRKNYISLVLRKLWILINKVGFIVYMNPSLEELLNTASSHNNCHYNDK